MFNGGLVWGVSWIWYLVGTLGIGGTVALFYLAPAVLPLILRFLTGTRLGVGIMVGLIAFMVADIHRSRSDTNRYEAEKAAFAQAQADRDKRIAQETRDEVWKQIANATAENTAIDTDVKEFHDALPPISPSVDNPFIVGAASCRLRNIAGFAGCGPVRAQGVPKARSKSAGTGSGDRSRLRLPGLITRGFSGTEKGQ